MAIKNENGNYLKIVNIGDSDLTSNSINIMWELWANKETKENPTDFDKPKKGFTRLETLDSKLKDKNKLDKNKNIKDNRITVSYQSLKENPEFSQWIDC